MTFKRGTQPGSALPDPKGSIAVQAWHVGVGAQRIKGCASKTLRVEDTTVGEVWPVIERALFEDPTWGEAARFFDRDRKALAKRVEQLMAEMRGLASYLDSMPVLAVTNANPDWQEGVDDARTQLVARLRARVNELLGEDAHAQP